MTKRDRINLCYYRLADVASCPSLENHAAFLFFTVFLPILHFINAPPSFCLPPSFLYQSPVSHCLD